MDLDMGHLDGAAVAHQSLQDLEERHENARRVMIDFALRAVLEGHPIEEVMAAVGFQGHADCGDEFVEYQRQMFGGLFAAYGSEVKSPRRQFADMLAEAIRELVLKGEAQ